jgi:hypothetical protein
VSDSRETYDPSEQARSRPLSERLAQEAPDLTGTATAPQPPEGDDEYSRQPDVTADLRESDTRDSGTRTYAEDLGTAADDWREPEQITSWRQS